MTERSHSGTAVAVVIFAAMTAGLIYRYWPSEERDIRRHLSNLAETISIPSSDSEVERITRFAALREYFDPDLRVDLDGREIVSREAVIGLLSQWQAPPGGVAVEFVDVTVALVDQSAQINLTAKASTTDPKTGESTLEQRHADVRMIKRDGDWVISSAITRN